MSRVSTFFGDDIHDKPVLLLDGPNRIVWEVAHVRAREDLGDSRSWRDHLLALKELILEMLGEKIAEPFYNSLSSTNVRIEGGCRTCLYFKYFGTGALSGTQRSVRSIR